MNKFDHVDWESIHAKLPIKKTPEDRERRKLMFRQFDPNGNGFLSLAEVDKGIYIDSWRGGNM
jgi:hypothetical protein